MSTSSQGDVVTTSTMPCIFQTVPDAVMADVIIPMLDATSLIHLGATNKKMLSEFVGEVESRVPKIKQEIARLLLLLRLEQPNNNILLEKSSYPHPPLSEDVDKAFTLEQEGLTLVDSNLSICQKYNREGFDSLFSLRKWFQYHPDHDYANASDEMLPLLPRIFYRYVFANSLDEVIHDQYMRNFVVPDGDNLERMVYRLFIHSMNRINDRDTTMSWSFTTSSSFDSFVGWMGNGGTYQEGVQQRLQSFVDRTTECGRVEVFRVKARRHVWESIRHQHENNILLLDPHTNELSLENNILLDPYLYMLMKMDRRLADLGTACIGWRRTNPDASYNDVLTAFFSPNDG